MKIFRTILAFVGVLLTGAAATAQPAKLTIVPVHGAFADASSWYGVIAILERDGYSVVRREHRQITGGSTGLRMGRAIGIIGHNLPQEAPKAFAEAVIDMDRA